MIDTNTRIADGSGAMFDRIAARYDILNRILSLGLDRGWRRRLVRAADPGAVGGTILDLATGTADVALALARAYPHATVLGIDPSRGMLELGRRKVAAAGLAARIELRLGDAQALALDNASCAAATMAFGIRNVPDRDAVLREMRRVVRPGGAVAILELGEPRGTPLAWAARLHVHHVVPRLGAWLSGAEEYRYLQASIAAFPSAEAFAERMRAADLSDVNVQVLGFGVVHLYTARVPE